MEEDGEFRTLSKRRPAKAEQSGVSRSVGTSGRGSGPGGANGQADHDPGPARAACIRSAPGDAEVGGGAGNGKP